MNNNELENMVMQPAAIYQAVGAVDLSEFDSDYLTDIEKYFDSTDATAITEYHLENITANLRQATETAAEYGNEEIKRNISKLACEVTELKKALKKLKERPL